MLKISVRQDRKLACSLEIAAIVITYIMSKKIFSIYNLLRTKFIFPHNTRIKYSYDKNKKCQV